MLILLTGHLFGQKADTIKFDRIFGTHCPDTLTSKNKKHTYVLQDRKGRSYVTAYSSKKEKWSANVNDLIYCGDHNTPIECIDFFYVNEKLVIRLLLDKPIVCESKKIYHVDLNPKNGKLVDTKK